MENNLPNGWALSNLESIADWASGGTPKSTKASYYGGDIPWLIIGDLNDGNITSSQKTITKLGLENSSAKMVPVGAVLCAMYGSIGKLGITTMPCATNQAIAFTEKIHGGIPNKYLFYYLFSIKQYLLDIGKGGAQQNISQSVLKQVTIPIAPLAEQQRIVAKLDELMEKIDRSRARLERIPKILKRFRQSILSAAVRGKLTEDWRDKNPNQTEVKTKALKKERRNELNDKIDEYNLFDLPNKWQWKTISDVADVKGGKRLPKGENLVSYKTPFPYIKAGDLKNGTVLTNQLQYLLPQTREKIKRYIVEKGDVYITNVGACIGDAGIIPDELHDANLTENALKMCNLDGVLNSYLSLWLRSAVAQDFINRTILSAAQGKLALGRVEVFPIPLPSKEEQFEIVKRVGQLFSLADKIEARYYRANRQLNRLPQSLLSRAFRGELVDQDENDEPAAALLEKIRAIKALASNKKGETKEYRIESVAGFHIAAELNGSYEKLEPVNIPENKKAFAKQVLGGKIVSLFKDDPNFTHIKFQKLQYLAEHLAEVDLNWNYYRQSAGPYDPKFMHTVALKLKTSKWLEERKYKFYPLEKVDKIEGYYDGYFGPAAAKLDSLFTALKNSTEDEAEIVATLYAVWNNMILKKERVNDDVIVSTFFEWSDRKKKYSQEQVIKALAWMKKNRFMPMGFGKLIKERRK